MKPANEWQFDLPDNILSNGGVGAGNLWNAARQRATPRPRSSRLASLALFVSLCLALLICLAPAAEAAVIAIDYGAQWFKVSLVKPGVPLEIVLNRESKRKTRSIVALRDGKRTFDTEAVNLVGFATWRNYIHGTRTDATCRVRMCSSNFLW